MLLWHQVRIFYDPKLQTCWNKTLSLFANVKIQIKSISHKKEAGLKCWSVWTGNLCGRCTHKRKELVTISNDHIIVKHINVLVPGLTILIQLECSLYVASTSLFLVAVCFFGVVYSTPRSQPPQNPGGRWSQKDAIPGWPPTTRGPRFRPWITSWRRFSLGGRENQHKSNQDGSVSPLYILQVFLWNGG